jgi:2-phosphoglycerate kinase
VVQLKRRADGKEVIVIDEDDVKETVKEALERAAREARDKRQN